MNVVEDRATDRRATRRRIAARYRERNCIPTSANTAQDTNANDANWGILYPRWVKNPSIKATTAAVAFFASDSTYGRAARATGTSTAIQTTDLKVFDTDHLAAKSKALAAAKVSTEARLKQMIPSKQATPRG